MSMKDEKGRIVIKSRAVDKYTKPALRELFINNEVSLAVAISKRSPNILELLNQLIDENSVIKNVAIEPRVFHVKKDNGEEFDVEMKDLIITIAQNGQEGKTTSKKVTK